MFRAVKEMYSDWKRHMTANDTTSVPISIFKDYISDLKMNSSPYIPLVILSHILGVSVVVFFNLICEDNPYLFFIGVFLGGLLAGSIITKSRYNYIADLARKSGDSEKAIERNRIKRTFVYLMLNTVLMVMTFCTLIFYFILLFIDVLKKQ